MRHDSASTTNQPGLQLYTLRDRMDDDLEGTLEQVAALGYEKAAGLLRSAARLPVRPGHQRTLALEHNEVRSQKPVVLRIERRVLPEHRSICPVNEVNPAGGRILSDDSGGSVHRSPKRPASVPRAMGQNWLPSGVCRRSPPHEPPRQTT
ncbi:MAG: hypothetical protein V5A22_09275 [Salinivenus sp.]